jgi:hypothetical protein
MWFPSGFGGWMALFFACGGWPFLLGVLRIMARRRGVLLVSSWWFVWLSWFLDGQFCGALKYATICRFIFRAGRFR